MSGHGSFSAIGSGMKVPQPLDMPKVEELQLGKGKLGALNVEGHKTEVQIADTRLDQTNRLAANLDAMLLRAAKTASAPVDVKAIKDTLVAAGLDKATRKLIEGAAKKAQTSFQAINQFSGRQIADALVKDEKGRFGWDDATPVGKAVKAALDAQADLSELLYNALNFLPANANARARGAIEEAMFQADRRASELQTLVCDFADMAEKAGNDPSINARLDKTLAAVFEGRAAVTTVVETRLAGLPDEDADPALDSANAVSSKPLGSGQVNTVYQIGYKDGSTYIFKPEAPGRQAEAKAASRCWRMQSERHNLRQECAGRCKQPSGSAVPSRPPLPHRQARLVRGVSLFAKCIFYGQHKHGKNES